MYQDELGFVWIASDLGVIRFDGTHFVHLEKLRSSYPKQFLTTSKGHFLVAHDGGISKIIQNLEEGSIHIEEFIPGRAAVGSDNVMYPKTIYEDQNGNLWISEVFSVVRYDGESLHRYSFSEKYRTGSFIRSFEFAEDKSGNFFTSSQQGYMFWLNEETDTFELIPNKSDIDPGTINAIINEPYSDNIWAATSHGIYEVYKDENQSNVPFSLHRIFDLRGVSALSVAHDSSIYAGGWNNWETGLTKIIQTDDGWVVKKIENFEQNTINRIFPGNKNMIWISSDDGITLKYNIPFYRLPIQQERSFVQSISKHPDEDIFYMTDAFNVYEIIPATNDNDLQSRVIFNNTSLDDLLTISATKNGIYAGSSLGKLYFIPYTESFHQEPKKEELVLVTENENSIFYSFTDSDNNYWFAQYNEIGVHQISNSGEISEFRTDQGLDQSVNIIRQGPEGHIIAGSYGEKKLYIYNPDHNSFSSTENITSEKNVALFENVVVNDLAIDEHGNVFIASNHGIWMFDAQTERFDMLSLGDSSEEKYIKAIILLDDGDLWFGTENGAFFHNRSKGLTIEFDEEKGGIPSRTIAYRGILQTPQNGIWIATPSGVGILEQAEEFEQTRKPILLSATVNDEKVDFTKEIEFSNTSVASLQFVSLTHPGSGITYEYRLSEYEPWIQVQDRNEITLLGISSGRYDVQIRALQISGHIWSDPLIVPVHITPPWYFQSWAILGYILIIIFIVFISTSLYTRRLRKIKIELENMVEARVKELRDKNAELTFAQKKLSESESRYRSFYDLSPVGIAINRIDDGQFLNCNEQFTSMTGYSADEIRKKTLHDLSSDEYKTRDMEQVEKLKKTGKYGPFEKELLHKDGHKITVLVNGVQLTDAKDDEVIYSVIQDITERKRFEQQLLKLNDDKDRLVATIAHDIRNPLSTIYSYSDILIDDDQLDEDELKHLFDRIHQSANTALTIASNLLELSTLENEDGNLTKKDINVPDLFDTLKNKFDENATRKNITLEFNCNGVDNLFAHQSKIERVFDNLISNALKFTKDGGKVNISIEAKDQNFLITISDDGIGIPKDMQDKIFDRFTAAKRPGLYGEQSTGLGMSIVKEIIDQHSGGIWLQSTLNIGTTFFISLPKE